MSRRLGSALVLLAALAAGAAGAATFEPRDFPSPEHERRYRTLVHELRCLVCQNQNLADSDADLAADLRRKVYEMILAGDDDEAVIEYMVARYGDFVLYKPPLRPTTVGLWFGPFVLCAAGLLVLARHVRRRSAGRPTLSEAERRRIESALAEPDGRTAAHEEH